LPKPRDVECEPLPSCEFAEVQIHRGSDTTPSPEVRALTKGIPKRISNVVVVELDAFFFQAPSLAAVIAE
jgi:hypothetical protein